jgi:hypothetical protein
VIRYWCWRRDSWCRRNSSWLPERPLGLLFSELLKLLLTTSYFFFVTVGFFLVSLLL